jgi:hypothetical protein
MRRKSQIATNARPPVPLDLHLAPGYRGLLRAGRQHSDLNQYQVTEFSLDDVNQAVEHAAGDNPFMLTVVRP